MDHAATTASRQDLWRATWHRFFGYDFFISYAWADGRLYAEALEKALASAPNNYRCFIDRKEMGGGQAWRASVRNALRQSSVMVLVASPAALRSNNVFEEIETFSARQRPLIPIELGSRLAELADSHRARALLEERLRFQEHEAPARLARGEPSSEAVSFLSNSFGFVRVARRRTLVLGLAVCFFAALAAVAVWQWHAAQVRERISIAAQRDAEAGRHFADAARFGTAWDLESARQTDLQIEISRLDATALAGRDQLRLENLRREFRETADNMIRLTLDARSARAKARGELQAAEAAWRRASLLSSDAASARRAPAGPRVFSVEILSVGFGESLILHYGEPDAPRFIVIDGGRAGAFEATLQARLERLRGQWGRDGVLPLDYVMVSNQDDDRIGGLERMFRQLVEKRTRGEPIPYQVRNVWFNSFGPGHDRWQKAALRLHLEQLQIPLNKPFASLVMRPARGRVLLDLGNGLTATVLNPTVQSLWDLHKFWDREARRRGQPTPDWPREDLGDVRVLPADTTDLAGQAPSPSPSRDRSVPNRASLVVLFEFGEPPIRFLHAGDAGSDQIEAGLRAAGLTAPDGSFKADLMLVPHQGSDRNVDLGFFRRIQADQYLFTGDGTHGNPEVDTLEMIVAARSGSNYSLVFINRDGRETHGEKLDAFFLHHPPDKLGYRRVFRSSRLGALTVDLADRVRY